MALIFSDSRIQQGSWTSTIFSNCSKGPLPCLASSNCNRCWNNRAAFQCVKIYEIQMRKYEILKLRHRAYGVYLEDHPRTCKWLGSPPIYKPWSSAIWKGSHNPILRGLRIATYVRPGSPSSKYGTIAIQRKQTKQSSKQSTTNRLKLPWKLTYPPKMAFWRWSSFSRLVGYVNPLEGKLPWKKPPNKAPPLTSGTTASGEFPSNLEGAPNSPRRFLQICFVFLRKMLCFMAYFLKVY